MGIFKQRDKKLLLRMPEGEGGRGPCTLSPHPTHSELAVCVKAEIKFWVAPGMYLRKRFI